MPGIDLSRDYLHPRLIPLPLASLAVLAVLATTVWYGWIGQAYPDYARFFGVAMTALAFVLAQWVMPRHFSVGFLLSTLLFVTNWRIAAMMGSWPIMLVSAACAVIYVGLFFDCLRNDWRSEPNRSWFAALEWQMTVIRIYFGFDMVGHFTEKMFAGSASHAHMSQVFAGFGVTSPDAFVIIGGLCELAIAIGIGAGLLTRMAAVGATLYFMIANHYGAHFDNGFTWANGPDGGWEYPLLMAVFYLSFALSGAGRFSLDGWLIAHGLMPRALMKLCVSRTSQGPTLAPQTSSL